MAPRKQTGLLLALALLCTALTGTKAASESPEEQAAKAEGLPALLKAGKASPSDLGLGADADLTGLAVEKVFPVFRINQALLEGAGQIDSAEPLLEPLSGLWFPVSLNGAWCGVLKLTPHPSEKRWLAESIARQDQAGALSVFRKRYPDKKLKVALSAAMPHAVFLIIDGLGYDNLTMLPNSKEGAERIVETPPPARNVLEVLKTRANRAQSAPE